MYALKTDFIITERHLIRDVTPTAQLGVHMRI